MADFYIKQNDTAKNLKATVQDYDGAAVDITGATVIFNMSKKGRATTKVSASAVILDAANGLVEYQWQPGDTDTPGVFCGEFEVAYSDSTIETFPNNSNIEIVIIGEIS